MILFNFSDVGIGCAQISMAPLKKTAMPQREAGALIHGFATQVMGRRLERGKPAVAGHHQAFVILRKATEPA